MNKGVKAFLVGCVEEFKNFIDAMQPQVDVTILDGAAVVHLLHPKFSKTFADFANDVYLPYLLKQLQSSVTLDVIWDRYDQNSLKPMKESTKEQVEEGMLSPLLVYLLSGLTFYGEMKIRRSFFPSSPKLLSF